MPSSEELSFQGVMSTKITVEYELSDKAWAGYHDLVRKLVLENECRSVCEIGAGANPTLPVSFVEEHGVDYVLLDISETELAKAPASYRKRVQDVSEPLTAGLGEYDLVFSKMLAEHVRDGEIFHRNMHALLKPGGIAFHFFPTLYAPPFVLNYLLPERLATAILNLVQRGRANTGLKGKFPAHYDWCRGPTGRQLKRLESVGFEQIHYIGFFGHAGYYKKWPLIERLHRVLARWLARRALPQLTSFAYVILRRSQ